MSFIDRLQRAHTAHLSFYRELPVNAQENVRALAAPAWDGHLIRMFLDLALEYGPKLIALIMSLQGVPTPLPAAIGENGTKPDTQP